MTEIVSHQEIEDAYRWAGEITKRLPDSIESREARRLIEVSEGLAHQARERVRPEPSEGE
jgi:hypothetical protein